MPDLYAYIDRVLEFMEQAVTDWLVAGEPWIKIVADGTIWESVPNQLVVIGLLYTLIGVFILGRGLARVPIVGRKRKCGLERRLSGPKRRSRTLGPNRRS